MGGPSVATAEPTRADGVDGTRRVRAPRDAGAEREPAPERSPAPVREKAAGRGEAPVREKAAVPRQGGAPEAASSPPAPPPPPPPPPAPRSRWRRFAFHPVTVATTLSAVLQLVWFFTFANSGGDLAAQDAWAEFVGRHPDSAYNLAWYGGMHPVSYSIVSPYLMHVLGVRTTLMLASTVSAGLIAYCASRIRAVRNPHLVGLAGVYALLCNTGSGRVTFGLGLMFGIAAVAAVFTWPEAWRGARRTRAVTAALCAALATAGSPVAGLYVGLVAVAMFLCKRRKGAYVLGITPILVVGASTLLFPFSGTQPMSFGSSSLPLAFALFCFFLVPKGWHTVRITSAVYFVVVLGVWIISSQIGSNITRLAMLFVGVVLVAALPHLRTRGWRWWTAVIGICGFTFWIGFKTADDIVHTTPAASWGRELAPLIHQLQHHDAEKGRVEVVPTGGHREASALAPYFNLARGWTRQADMERNPLFYDSTLNSANYHEWLKRWAVHFVVLPTSDDKPDGDGATRERALISAGQPYLDLLWADANWQVYEVEHPVQLAEPPATVTSTGQSELVIKVTTPGRVLIRIPYSPWLSVVDKDGKAHHAPKETEESKNREDDSTPKTFRNLYGCLYETPEDKSGDKWTELLAPHPGTYHIAGPYQIPRGTPCPQELRPPEPEPAN
nr:MFS transporter [Streptomyces sp. SID8380]